jgi:hypothetical protein
MMRFAGSLEGREQGSRIKEPHPELVERRQVQRKEFDRLGFLMSTLSGHRPDFGRVFTLRRHGTDTLIRAISARYMHRKEADHYAKTCKT